MAVAWMAFGLGEILIARGQRHAIGRTHRWHANDFDWNIKIACHAGHHLQLLVILLAKDGEVGTALDEELGHNGCNAVKEVGAELVFKIGLWPDLSEPPPL